MRALSRTLCGGLFICLDWCAFILLHLQLQSNTYTYIEICKYVLLALLQSVHNATVNAPLMLLSVVKLLILLPYCYGAVHYSAFRLLSVCQLKSVGLPQSAEPNSQLTGRLQFSSL